MCFNIYEEKTNHLSAKNCLHSQLLFFLFLVLTLWKISCLQVLLLITLASHQTRKKKKTHQAFQTLTNPVQGNFSTLNNVSIQHVLYT